MSESVVLTNVQFNWLDVLAENKKYGNYRAECLIEPDSENDKILAEAILAAATEKWGETKAPNYLKSATANKKICRKAGETMNPNRNTGEIAEYYLGKVVLNASRKADRDGAPSVYCARENDSTRLVRADADSNFEGLVRPTSGSFGDVIVNIWAWEHDGAPQINCTLETIAFRAQGEPLGVQRGLSVDQEASLLGVEIEIEDDGNPFQLSA